MRGAELGPLLFGPLPSTAFSSIGQVVVSASALMRRVISKEIINRFLSSPLTLPNSWATSRERDLSSMLPQIRAGVS